MRSPIHLQFVLLACCGSTSNGFDASDAYSPEADSQLTHEAGSTQGDVSPTEATDDGTAASGDTSSPCGSDPCNVETVLTDLYAPVDIVLDANSAYLSVSLKYTVEAVSVANGTVSLLDNAAAFPSYLVVDTSNVTYLTMMNQSIVQMPLTGGSEVYFSSYSTDYSAGRIAIDASSYLYWTLSSSTGEAGVDGMGMIQRQLTPDTVPQTLASNLANPTGIAVDSTYVYWSNRGTAANNYQDGTIAKMLKDGSGSVVTLATSQMRPDDIAIDGKNIYWSNFDGGTVMQLPLTGGTTPVQLASDPSSGALGIAVDSKFVYWVEETSGGVKAVPIGGGPVTTIATGLDSPISIATNTNWVYWVVEGSTSSATGSLMRMAKP